MDPILPEDIERYAVEHTSAVGDLYERLRDETYAQTEAPQMQVGPLEGRLLKMMAQMLGARRAVEIGTFTGYSALSIAEGMADDGVLYACDVDPDTTAIARRYFDEAPWGRKIELRVGLAIETLRTLDGPFDLAFIDADKTSYIDYWEALMPKMRPGGIICADNVLWSGRALAPEAASDRAIAAFNEHVSADGRVEHVMLTVRDGITMARKR